MNQMLDPLSPIKVVESVYDGLRRSDRDALEALTDPSIEIQVTKELAHGGDYEGMPGFFALFRNTFSLINSTIEIDTMFPIGDRQVVAWGRTTGAAHASKARFEARLVHVCSVENGRLVGFDAFVEDGPISAAIDAAAGD